MIVRITLSCIMFALMPVMMPLAESRIKDIVHFEGIRDNVLIGYGLVVGLNGTGDNLKNSGFTEKGLIDFLEKLGINTRGANLKTKNVAAVTVTASLPPFARSGSRISVDVSTIGDAKSLKGGLLLATPLLGADGEVYAVAQGPLSIGSKPGDDDGKSETTSPTLGFVSGGAIIEREIDFDLSSMAKINLALKDPDITTARSVEVLINNTMRSKIARAKDPGTVELTIPAKYKGDTMALLGEIENITIYPDTVAKVVIDEATGTIVIGHNVTISSVAVAQGNLMVKIGENEAFLQRITRSTPASTQKKERGSEIAVLPQATRLSDLVNGLNALGVKPKDLIAILKTIKQAGALHAEIVVK
jgi:flagellar P-ring protein precursor FlgI